eukprot:1872680-Rhodomonas_salina.1
MVCMSAELTWVLGLRQSAPASCSTSWPSSLSSDSPPLLACSLPPFLPLLAYSLSRTYSLLSSSSGPPSLPPEATLFLSLSAVPPSHSRDTSVVWLACVAAAGSTLQNQRPDHHTRRQSTLQNQRPDHHTRRQLRTKSVVSRATQYESIAPKAEGSNQRAFYRARGFRAMNNDGEQ